MSDERRKFPRVPLRIETEVKFPSWQVYSLIYTINISKGGMNLELPHEPTVGSALTIRLSAPDGVTVRVEATVRHTTKSGKSWSTGVAFTNLDDDKLQLIERAIRAHGVVLGAPGLTPRPK